MGTAYELVGDNVQALRWIREGIERNPQSHNGSEWIHVRILLAKLAIEKDSNWLQTQPILGLDFGAEAMPNEPRKIVNDIVDQPLELETVALHLRRQLRERAPLTPRPDPLLGQLFFEYANILALVDVLENAETAYEYAKHVGYPNIELANIRIAKMRELIKQSKRKNL